MLLLSAAGETAIVRLFLLDFAVDVHARYGGGVSAVLAAAAMGETKMLQLLFELGANLLDVDDRGYSTLHCASMYCYGLDTVTYLCGVAPSLIDWPASDGSTGLLLAVQHGLLDIARALLEHHANPRIADVQGITADALARAAGHWDLVALMDPPPDNPWIECQTDEGDVFFYNSVTGESSWYIPGPQIADEVETSVTSTPLCLMPLVSPLTALDDPDAAAKELLRRKKERQQRRRRKQPT
ncbi:hypothetical protein SPRG_07251 [Saprolegnia parasitica CBS 223.65]|uniref:WW domain-containing protein n=1 Tax=Saprolegnia parasitica (strain CBS 223.65) TaxID=695850 RepID=A0A067CB17_SAPPC|nr:hypothetical protein SPRG_07251 [Saprolegnia parasitica CBS 223.65]KDO27974.1 hypothetical protein SPRG_07251 [Saprolegnia parasitica CBS 223.65]|eukprot:XP_012201423.1 hypothetical protein SPRG_07251 [Saprolegnia parasitica CBS 223.65]